MNWPEELLTTLKEAVLQGVQSHIAVVATLVAILLLCALMRNFDTGTMGEGIEKSAFWVEYAAVALLLGQKMIYAKEVAQEAMTYMVTALNTATPVLFVASPGTGTAFLVATEVVSNLFQRLFLPAACILAVFSLLDNLSATFSISHFVDFLKKTIFWGLGLVMTVYMGVLSVQTCIATAEGTALHKTAKFAVGAWPVIGQYLAESFDAVSASAGVIYTTTGTGAMIAILTACMAPAVELLLLSGLLKLVSALTQPVADVKVCNCVGGVSSAISFMAGLVAVCAVLLTITIGLCLTVLQRGKGG